MKQRLLNLLIALDQFVFCVITLGRSDPDWTISACAWRWEQQGKWNGWMRPVIDWLFSVIEKDHCQQSYWNEISR